MINCRTKIINKRIRHNLKTIPNRASKLNLATSAFTLIELLAVIAILAIVMIIAVPTVLNTIATAKKGAFKDNALSVVKAVENRIMTDSIESTGNIIPTNGTFKVVDIRDIEIDNKSNLSGQIYIVNDNNQYSYYITLSNKEYIICNTNKEGITTGNIKDNNNVTCESLVNKYSKVSGNTLVSSTTNTDFKYDGALNNTEGYVKDNLMLHYDAINNTGVGHDNVTLKWRDLSGNNYDGELIDFTANYWNSDALLMPNKTEVIKGPYIQNDYMSVEIVFSDLEATAGGQHVFSNYNTGGIGIIIQDNVFRVQIYINGAYQTFNMGTYNFKQYYYVSVTYDGNTVIGYVNGQEKGKLVINGVIGKPTSNTIFSINANPAGTNPKDPNFIVGSINVKSARVYNKGLTPAEVIQNYNVDKERFNLE